MRSSFAHVLTANCTLSVLGKTRIGNNRQKNSGNGQGKSLFLILAKIARSRIDTKIRSI